jgi:hypothetical protein
MLFTKQGGRNQCLTQSACRGTLSPIESRHYDRPMAKTAPALMPLPLQNRVLLALAARLNE